MRKLVAVCITVSLAISACDTESNLNNCDFDEVAMLTNYADGIIKPRMNDLGTATVLLKSSVDAFVASPSTSLLVEARISFVAAYKQYQRCSSFAFGPGLVNGVPFRDRFNTFPTNTSFMETSIDAGTPVSESPQSVVGFPAIDYLLFGSNGETDQAIVDKYVSGSNAANRGVFLTQLADELKTTTESINTGWDSYQSTFISNTGSALGTSISMMGNEFNRDYEILKNFKFKVPLGKLNGGVVLPDKVEGYYSGITAELSVEQMSAIKDFYLGVSETGADGLGLADYLQCLQTESIDKLLHEAISERFQAIENQLSQIPDPMSETLSTNKPVVDQAYTDMQMTVPLIKHEMTTAFGVQINYDSGDGD